VHNFVVLRFTRKLQTLVRLRKGTLGTHGTPALNALEEKVLKPASMLGHHMGV